MVINSLLKRYDKERYDKDRMSQTLIVPQTLIVQSVNLLLWEPIFVEELE